MRNPGIRARLVALVLVALAPGLGLILYSAAEQRAQGAREAQRAVEAASTMLAESLASRLDVARGLLLGLSAVPVVRQGERAGCERVVREVLARAPELANVLVLDPAGDVVCSAAPVRGRVNGADRRYFRDALASRSLATSGFMVSRSAVRFTFDLALPLYSPANELQSVLVVELDLETLDGLLAGLGLPAGAEALALDAEGVILSRWPEPRPARGEPWGGGPPARLAGVAAGERAGSDGETRLYAARAVASGGMRAEPIAVVGVPRAMALAPAEELLRRSLALYGVVSAVALLAALLVAELAFARPLGRLVAAAGRLSAGDYAARTGLRPGSALGDLGAAFDDLARALQQLREVEDQLRHAQKMEAVGRLAGGIAHDFNNLLTAIVSFAGLARDGLPEGHPAREDVDEVLAAANRAGGLTRRLLAFGRRDVAAPRLLDLGGIVRGVEAMLRRVLGPRIELVVEAPACACVRGDAGQLEQVVMNLAVNASDAMPDGGRLEIAVREVPEGERPGELPPGPLVALSVEDTGVGMDEATLSRAFEPFFTTKPQGKGTGLGLSTVYGIVRQSHGAVRVTSAPGAGARFTVYLPAQPCPPEIAAPPAERDAPRGSERVLVVEDDDAVRRIAVRALERAGYVVRDAARPSVAGRIAAEEGPFDLLLSDVLLPEESGPALAARIGGRARRVLFMSGYTGGQLESDGVVPPDVELLAKPFAPEVLLRHVRRVLDGGAARGA